jgi:hypothetical protein
MRLADADQRKLLALLEELGHSVEELLLSGLTAASESTRRLLGVSFQEASRMRLLRLGSTLRSANEELGRFTQHKDRFSRKRLCFFLTRAWLLGQGLARSLRQNDENQFDRLLCTPAAKFVDRVEAVTLGVSRKLVPGACAFDFRLRALTPTGPVAAGGRLGWSCVFPMPAGSDVPPEGFLMMSQKQGFKAEIFLAGKVLTITGATITPADSGGGRITLAEQSTVTADKTFTDWERFQTWDPAAAVERLRGHQPGPLDLDIELQEEVVLHDWQIGPAIEEDTGQQVYPIAAQEVMFHAVVNAGEENKPLKQALDGFVKKKNLPPLFALLHYERCRLVLQPLSVFRADGPQSLTMSKEKVNMAALLKTIKF